MTFQGVLRLFLCGALAPVAFASGDEPASQPAESGAAVSQPPAEKEKRSERRRRSRRPSFTALTRDQIVDQVNNYRRRSARHPVVVNPELQAAAQSFAEHMARTAVFSHTADGRQPSMRAMQAGYESMMVTENIAYQGASGNLAQQLVNMWVNSPGHYSNIMRHDVTETGVGVAQGYNGQYYAVQLFGRPGSRRFKVQVHNTTPEPQSYKLGRHEYSVAPNETRTHSLGRKAELTLAVSEKPAEEEVLRPEKDEKFEIRTAVVEDADAQDATADTPAKEVEIVRYEVPNVEDTQAENAKPDAMKK